MPYLSFTALVACLLLMALPARSNEATPIPKRVAVVSLVAHNVSLLRIGFTVFNNHYAETKSAAANVADPVVDTIAREIQLESGSSVRRIDVARADHESWGAMALASSGGLFPAPLKSLQDPVAKLASVCECDELLILTDNFWREVNGTNQTARGFTLLYSGPEQSTALMPITLTRVEKATLKTISSSRIGLRAPGISYRWPEGKPEVVPLPLEELSTATAVFARQLTSSDINAFGGVRFALFQLGLRPSCAPLNYDVWRYGLPPRRPGEPDDPPPPLPAGADPSSCR